MFNRENFSKENLDFVKRHLSITWDDDDTDAKVIDIILDAQVTLNHKLGAEIDYFQPSAERRLFLAYISYVYNECQNDFDAAYMSEIYQLRHKYEVIAARNEK